MTRYLMIATIAGLLSAGAGWATQQTTDPTRPNCPGQIQCPLSGKLVCEDRCPLGTNDGDLTPTMRPPCRGN
ncbi:MAG: hypothetical protein GC162_00610 [Planctomycetes bacterium]|nr:hypothetical protein [Planctomycetota bacterium]